MWRELSEQAGADEADAEAVLDSDPSTQPRAGTKPKSFRQAFTQILIADLSMSLDNVLAVAGAAREHPFILVFGLLLSSGWRYQGTRPLGLNMAVGGVAGLLKGATGISGPPVILYLLAGPEAARQHRANLILFFACISIISVIPPAIGGLVDLAVVAKLLLVLPAMLVAVPIGTRLFHVIPERLYKRLALGFLVATGTITLLA
jgi:uncharacterized membrane protein YfcA